jgi:dihydropyrimidinase
MPFGGTTSADDFETGTRAAAFGGTTTLVDFAIQYKGQALREAFDTWMAKAASKAVADYSFHCIITDLGDSQMEEMGALVSEGVPSFKLFMAYPGVFMLDDATIFKAMSQAAKYNGLICMHAENGGVIDVIVRKALAEGKRAPKYHALTRPTTAEGEATGRAIALAEMAGAPVYIVHLSCNDALEKVREARDRGIPAYAETCPQYLYLSLDQMEAPGFEAAKYVFTPPLREKWHQDKLWQGLTQDTLQVVSTDQNSQWRPGNRAPAESSLYRRRARPPVLAESLRATGCHCAREAFRAFPAQGHDCGRIGRGHCGVRSHGRTRDQRQDTSHARRLLHVRGNQGDGHAEDGAVARACRD